MKRAISLLVLFGAGHCCAAVEDKASYSWTNPTPRHLLREMGTDRPDTTESPATVDAGHVQIELSVAAHEHDRRNPERSDTRTDIRSVVPLNVRVGLRHDTEVQFVFDGYVRAKEVSGGAEERRSGAGDVTVRVKRNFWGNDGGDTALAVMPFVKLPTNSGGVGNRRVEGGLIVPFGFSLGPWGAGAMTEIDVVRNAADDGYTATWVNTFTIGHDLTEKLGGFLECVSEAGEGPHALSFDCGLTYAWSADLQLDCGVNLGLTRAATDRVVFVGMSRRF